MCSTERSPAPTARAMSATVASRCTSTNWVRPPAPDGSGTRHSTSGAALPPWSSTTGSGSSAGSKASGGHRFPGRAPPVGQARGQVEQTRCRTRYGHAVELLRGHEGAEAVVVAQPATDLAEQVHRRVPPAADQQEIAFDRRDGADLAAQERGDERVRDPLDAAGAGHDPAAEDGDARLLALLAAARGPADRASTTACTRTPARCRSSAAS